MANASEIIGKRLYHAGCRWAFGIPGGEVLFLMEGLKKSGVEFVLTKHENTADARPTPDLHVILGFFAYDTLSSTDLAGRKCRPREGRSPY